MPERKKRCIVTYASSWASLAAARSLGEEKVEVIISDTCMMAPGCFSKYDLRGTFA
jgi:predicted ATP-grasp superfamily ATP-dependent carboligase